MVRVDPLLASCHQRWGDVERDGISLGRGETSPESNDSDSNSIPSDPPFLTDRIRIFDLPEKGENAAGPACAVSAVPKWKSPFLAREGDAGHKR